MQISFEQTVHLSVGKPSQVEVEILLFLNMLYDVELAHSFSLLSR